MLTNQDSDGKENHDPQSHLYWVWITMALEGTKIFIVVSIFSHSIWTF